MTFKEAKGRHAALCEEVRKQDHAYYVLCKPQISDGAYDALRYELLDLEKRFPELATPGSRTQRAGGGQVEKPTATVLCQKMPFRMPGPSDNLDKMTEPELRAYVARL